MLSLPGYRITEELHAGAKTLIYRGFREQDQCPVILKTLGNDYPTQKELACLQHEYALTKDWDENDQLRGLPRTYALVKHQHTQVLVQQDIGRLVIISHGSDETVGDMDADKLASFIRKSGKWKMEKGYAHYVELMPGGLKTTTISHGICPTN
jgi:hypothetical protein